MIRLYGKKEKIDTETVKNFFNKRAKKDVENLMIITTYYDKNNLEKRQKEEIDVISSNVDFNFLNDDSAILGGTEFPVL